jgi:hypothetical protein
MSDHLNGSRADFERVRGAAETLRAYAAGMKATAHNLPMCSSSDIHKCRETFSRCTQDLDAALEAMQRVAPESAILPGWLAQPLPAMPGDVVQLQTDTNPTWAGCCMVVSNVGASFLEGHISVPAREDRPAHTVFLRAGWDEVACIGRAEHVPVVTR